MLINKGYSLQPNHFVMGTHVQLVNWMEEEMPIAPVIRKWAQRNQSVEAGMAIYPQAEERRDHPINVPPAWITQPKKWNTTILTANNEQAASELALISDLAWCYSANQKRTAKVESLLMEAGYSQSDLDSIKNQIAKDKDL